MPYVNPWGGYQQSVNQLGQAAGMAQRGRIAGERNQLYGQGLDIRRNQLGLQREKFGAEQTAADTALRKQKMTLLAKLFRDVTDQAGYDQAVKNFKSIYPDTGDIPAVYNKQQVDQMVSELDPLTMFEKKEEIKSRYREPKFTKEKEVRAKAKETRDIAKQKTATQNTAIDNARQFYSLKMKSLLDPMGLGVREGKEKEYDALMGQLAKDIVAIEKGETPSYKSEEPKTGKTEYSTAEEVREAYNAGKLSRTEAVDLLRNKFGMK